MSREEIEKLLGGYATGALSEAERHALFEAALEDQELFDALAKEQALREVIEQPGARQQLLAALGAAHEPSRLWAWLRRPAVLAMAGGLATLVVVSGIWWRQFQRPPTPQKLVADATTSRRAYLIAPPQAAAKKSAVAPKKREFLAPLNLPAARTKVEESQPLPEPPTLAARDVAGPAAPPPVTAEARPVPAPAAPAAVGQLSAPSVRSFEALSSRAKAMKIAKAASATPIRPPVAYHLALKGADGEYAALPPNAVIHAGDSIRIEAEANQTGTLRLFEKTAAGWNTVATAIAEQGEKVLLPTDGAVESQQAGQREFLLEFTRQDQPVMPTADANSLAGGAGGPSIRIVIEFR